jgi:hypothetical protein
MLASRNPRCFSSGRMSGFTMNVTLTQLYVKLEQNGFGVDSYGDPFLALDNKTHLYDLVILDIRVLTVYYHPKPLMKLMVSRVCFAFCPIIEKVRTISCVYITIYNVSNIFRLFGNYKKDIVPYYHNLLQLNLCHKFYGEH